MDLEKIVKYEDTSYLYIYMYQIIGFIPFDNPHHHLRGHLLAIHFHIINFMVLTMHAADVIRLLLGQDIAIDCVFEFVTAFAGSAQFVMLNAKRAELVTLMKRTREYWELLIGNEGKTVMKFERKIRYLAYFFFVSGLILVAFYFITAQIVRLPPTTVNGTERRILPFRFYLDVQEQPWYNIVCAMEAVVTLNFVVLATVCESVGPYLMMMACGYLRSIQDRFVSMKTMIYNDISKNNTVLEHQTNVNKLSMSNVQKCIIFHQKVMNYCEEIENFSSSLFLVQLMSTTYNVSLIGFKLLERDANFLKYMSLLIANLFRVFTCQWFSQYLLNESCAIVDAAYGASLMHSKFELQANRMLLLIMLRANKPVQLTAGGFINLSLESFKKMITSAISFLTVLRSMRI